MTVAQLSLLDLELPRPDRPHVTIRRRGPETSAQAAALALPRSGTARMQVLTQLAAHPGGMTDLELANQLGKPINCVIPRRSELVKEGWVHDSGFRRLSSSGVRAILWELTEAGEKAWREL